LFEINNHIQLNYIPKKLMQQMKPKEKQNYVQKQIFFQLFTVFGSLLLLLPPPRRSYSRTSIRSIRMGGLRILFNVAGVPRLNCPSVVIDVNDDDVADEDAVVPLRFPAFVIRNISVNK
jgi:hypothetical protein